jgi:hypothetical protein
MADVLEEALESPWEGHNDLDPCFHPESLPNAEAERH